MQTFDPERVKETLATLRSHPPKKLRAESHDFRLSPPLSEEDAQAFEREHGVKLPADFRRFLTEVGNGGPGPFHGVFPLGTMDDNFDLSRWHEQDGFVGILSSPFPFDSPWNDLPAIPSNQLASENPFEYDKKMEAFEHEYWGSSRINGSFPIFHEGCALRILLVVTGAEAGYLWEDRRSEYEGLNPLLLPDGSRATFWSWYETWLKDCLASS